MDSHGLLLIGPRSLEGRAATQVQEQTQHFIGRNKRKCRFVLLPDLSETSLQVCNVLPSWLEVIILSPGKWTRPTRWEQKRYDNVLELPYRLGGLMDEAWHARNFARYSYRFGIDWVVPSGAVLAFRGERPDPEVEGAIRYARSQEVRVFTRSADGLPYSARLRREDQ